MPHLQIKTRYSAKDQWQNFLLYPRWFAGEVVSHPWNTLRSLFVGQTRWERLEILDPETYRPVYEEAKRLSEKAGIPTPLLTSCENRHYLAARYNNGAPIITIREALLNDLLEQQEGKPPSLKEEYRAALGHEIGHIANHDKQEGNIWKAAAASVATGLAATAGALFALRDKNPWTRYVGAGLAGSTMWALSGPLLHKHASRQNELGAEENGARLTSPDTMISARKYTKQMDRIIREDQRRAPDEHLIEALKEYGVRLPPLVTDQPTGDANIGFAAKLYNGTIGKVTKKLYSTHPSTDSFIEHIEKMKTEQSTATEAGAQRK